MIDRVEEHWEGRRATHKADGPTTYTRVFLVVTDDPLDGAQLVRQATGVPSIGDLYVTETESDDTCVCVSVDPNQDGEDPRKWTVTCEYTDETKENPVDEPARKTWGSTARRVPLERDLDGDPIVNSANEPFDPPPEDEEYDLTLTITRNEATFDPLTIRAYQNKVNDAEFFDFPAGEVKCNEIVASDQERDDEAFVQVTYKFQIREGGWQLELLDQGFRQLDGAAVVNILDERGQFLTKPTLLDGNGHATEPGDPAFYLTYTVKGSVDFSPLGLES